MRLPRPSLRFVPIWQRNLRVWRRLMVPSLLGNFGEPLIYLAGLGYGLGRLVGAIDELPYMVFLATGIICSSAMNAASFEAMFSAYTRMSQQQTWAAMLATPLEVDDIVLGEILWAGTKALFSAAAILAVTSALGLVGGWRVLWALPVIALAGVSFAAMAMVMTAVSRSYDFFVYYFTLVMTPMMLLSGVFFPLDNLPAPVAGGAFALPLAHVVVLVRPLLTGGAVDNVVGHLAVVAAYAFAGFAVSVAILRRRLLR